MRVSWGPYESEPRSRCSSQESPSGSFVKYVVLCPILVVQQEILLLCEEVATADAYRWRMDQHTAIIAHYKSFHKTNWEMQKLMKKNSTACIKEDSSTSILLPWAHCNEGNQLCMSESRPLTDLFSSILPGAPPSLPSVCCSVQLRPFSSLMNGTDQ
jgi:hypothetical protein